MSVPPYKGLTLPAGLKEFVPSHEADMSTVSLTGMTRRRVAVLASRGRRRLTPDRRKVHRHLGGPMKSPGTAGTLT